MPAIKKGDLVERTYEALKKMIITLGIKPGEYLEEQALMKKLKIGRTPLRQAILLLKNEGFIESKPNRSPYVKEFNLEEVKELFESLVIIEKNISCLAAIRINKHELSELENIHNKVKKATEEKEFWHISNYNFGFHQIIAKACKNRFLEKTHYNIRVQAERLSYIAVSWGQGTTTNFEEHNTKILEQHSNLINCLNNHDWQKIEKVSIKHIRLFQDRILKSISETAAYPYLNTFSRQ